MTEVTAQKLTEKNSTKRELFSAYTVLLKKAKEDSKSKISPTEVAQKKKDERIIKGASTFSASDAIDQFGKFKFKAVTAISGLADDFQAELDKFTELQEAVTLTSQEVQEVHGIKAEVESLAALKLVNSEEILEHQKELEDVRIVIETEQAEFEKSVADTQILLKAKLKKEEEEYAYNLRITRRNEEDAYDQKVKKALDEHADEMRLTNAALTKRAEEIADQQTEIDRLREIEASMETEIKAASESAVADAKRSWDASQRIKTLTEDKAEKASIALLQEQSKTLTARNNELYDEVKALKTEVADANNRVDNIAQKSIEASAQSKITVNNEAASGKR